MNKHFLYLKISLLLIVSCLVGCSKAQTADQLVELMPTSSAINTTLHIIVEKQISKGFHGDFTNVKFRIDTASKFKILVGALNCTQDNSENITCNSSVDLSSIKSGIYRIVLTSSGGGGLMCDIFSYQHGEITQLIVNATSSGECILNRLMFETGLSKDEIRSRVKLMLNEPNAGEYNIETTLFDLFGYYGGSTNLISAWQKLVTAVKDNQPLPKANKSTIAGTRRSL